MLGSQEPRLNKPDLSGLQANALKALTCSFLTQHRASSQRDPFKCDEYAQRRQLRESYQFGQMRDLYQFVAGKNHVNY